MAQNLKPRSPAEPVEAASPPSSTASEKPTGDPVRKRTQRSFLARVPDAVWTAVVAVVLLVVLEVAAREGWVSKYVLAAPSAVWSALREGNERGLYASNAASTLGGAAAGFLFAFVVAIVVAGLLVSFPKGERIFYPFVVAFQTLPKVAIAPLVILAVGFGSSAKILIVAIVCFFPLLVNTLQGLKIRDRNHYELLKSLGANRFQMFRYLRVPGALPYIFAGMHISVIFALIGAIVAEFVGSESGLGRLLLFEKSAFNVPGVYAVLVLLMVFGTALHVLMIFLERRLVPWGRETSVTAP